MAPPRPLRSPLVALVVISLLSLGARVAWIGAPCQSPCRTAAEHTLIFDESYYVNAARVIAGIRPPPGAPYATAPLGDDPNSEHPQLVKVVIAGAIELLGDGPMAWRLGSLLCGSLAILGMYALVRAAGGGRWPAVAASALMALDNLILVHGRIGTLDIYALAAMVWAAVAYLRGHPLVAGAVIGVGACAKEVALYLLAVLVLFEALRFAWFSGSARASWTRREVGVRVARLAGCVISAGAVLVGLLAVLDEIAPPYDPLTGRVVGGGPFGHLAHMLTYAAGQSSPGGPTGIASYPWEWLVDIKPITYLYINPARPTRTLYDIHPAVHFLGMINPAILLLGLPALAWVGVRAVGLRGHAAVGRVGVDLEASGFEGATAVVTSDVIALALAWFVGTWLPFEVLSLIWSRTSYLYYMVIVMPGIYLAIVALIWGRGAIWGQRRTRWLLAAWAATVVVAAVVMYPLTPLP